MATDTMTRHLLEAARELLQQRDQLDRDLADLQRMLSDRNIQIDTARPSELAGARAASSASSIKSPSTRQIILDVLDSDHRDWPLAELVDGVVARGSDAKPNSIRSVISRLLGDGFIASERRGSYRALGTALSNSEATPDDGSGVAEERKEEV